MAPDKIDSPKWLRRLAAEICPETQIKGRDAPRFDRRVIDANLEILTLSGAMARQRGDFQGIQLPTGYLI